VLDRLFYFDTTLVFDTYIESLLREVDVAKRKTEDYANSLEIKVAERTAQLEALSKNDPLTGLFNQTEMRSLLQRSLNMLKRREGNISLAFFDVDDFKMVNDTYGHIAGDNILKALASSIQKHIRESDIACRYGGDEFCVIFLDATAQEAIDICHRVMQDFQLNPHQVNVSYGIAEMNSDNLMEADHFIGLADKAMYSAKEQKGIGT
jgi:diguanylate cyclase (GGDEF)-like protein